MTSLSAHYAVRAVLYVARDSDWHTTEDVSQATGIPQGYLSKIMNQLMRAGVFLSRRGSNGGFRINRDITKTSVLDAVRAVDSLSHLHVCCSCHAGIRDAGCAVKSLFTEIDVEVERRLRVATIGDLLSQCSAKVDTVNHAPATADGR